LDPQGRIGRFAVNPSPANLIHCLLALLFAAAIPATSSRLQAQSDPVERTFTEQRADVEKAVADVKTHSSGKLPALEGFVGPTQQPVERYERAYYQCLFQVIPSLSGETSVRVTARITAWYDDPDRQKSGYQVLSSNGRLESDALDRIQEFLERSGGAPAEAVPQVTTKYNLNLGPAVPLGSPPARVAGGVTKDLRRPEGMTSAQPVTEAEIEGLKGKREATEKRVQQLNNALKNLQELYDSQTKPENLIAIKKSGTPVYARPEDGGTPLFAAAAKDQFEMIEMRGDWVHVRISGDSRGWIRKAQLDFPDDSAITAAPVAGAKSAELFRVTREEVAVFPGKWEPLRGKTVKIFSVQPAQSPALETSVREKRAFVKQLFARAWKEHAETDDVTAGVVAVFDSADGGQVSATLASLAQWQQGKISDAAFWQSCSLDPPETFSFSAKKQ
jgi:hypothetical protein